MFQEMLIATMETAIFFLEREDPEAAIQLLEGVIRIVREKENQKTEKDLREECSGNRLTCGVPRCLECRNYLSG